MILTNCYDSNYENFVFPDNFHLQQCLIMSISITLIIIVATLFLDIFKIIKLFFLELVANLH